MGQAKISELKNRLSYYLRRVRRGETIDVFDRNVPIARLVPIRPSDKDGTAWLKRLEHAGIVRVGPMRGVKEILQRRPSGKKSKGVLEALLEERRTGR
jgi:prevent-host-death family protein